MIFAAKRDTEEEHGTWKRNRDTDNEKIICFSCPECGRDMGLVFHEIDFQGSVSPSVVCPGVDCDFHDFVYLQGWDD